MDTLPKDLICSITFTPSRGTKICTVSHPRFYNLVGKLVKFMIQREQRLRGFRVWKHTHIMIFLGKLSPNSIARYAPVLTRKLNLSLHELNTEDDWIFSYTWPRCTLERWKKVKEQDWDCYGLMESNDLTGFISPTALHDWQFYELNFLEEGCFELIGRGYDIPQLFRWIVGRLFNICRSRWKVIPDLFQANKVCSVGAAFVFEYVRQMVRELTGKAPWIRPFRERGKEVDIEAVMPADTPNSPSYGHIATNPAYH